MQLVLELLLDVLDWTFILEQDKRSAFVPIGASSEHNCDMKLVVTCSLN